MNVFSHIEQWLNVAKPICKKSSEKRKKKLQLIHAMLRTHQTKPKEKQTKALQHLQKSWTDGAISTLDGRNESRRIKIKHYESGGERKDGNQINPKRTPLSLLFHTPTQKIRRIWIPGYFNLNLILHSFFSLTRHNCLKNKFPSFSLVRVSSYVLDTLTKANKGL